MLFNERRKHMANNLAFTAEDDSAWQTSNSNGGKLDDCIFSSINRNQLPYTGMVQPFDALRSVV